MAGLGDVEPLLMPDLDDLDEGPFGPCGIGQLAYHGPAAVRVMSVDTSILHHALILIFSALWDVITHYVTILM